MSLQVWSLKSMVLLILFNAQKPLMAFNLHCIKKSLKSLPSTKTLTPFSILSYITTPCAQAPGSLPFLLTMLANFMMPDLHVPYLDRVLSPVIRLGTFISSACVLMPLSCYWNSQVWLVFFHTPFLYLGLWWRIIFGKLIHYYNVIFEVFFRHFCPSVPWAVSYLTLGWTSILKRNNGYCGI